MPEFHIKPLVLTVRAATAADADAIGRIQVETWRAAYAGLMPPDALEAASVEERRRMWRGGLSRELPPQRATFVAEAEGEVVGFASVGGCREPGSEDGEVYAIYVDQSRWGQGAGRALLERAEGSLRNSGFTEALLWVLDGNELAIRFYERAGWQPSGRKTDSFQGAEVVESATARGSDGGGAGGEAAAPLLPRGRRRQPRSRPS